MDIVMNVSPRERLALQFLAEREGLTTGAFVLRTLRETMDMDGLAVDALSYFGIAPGLYDPEQPCPQCDRPTRADPDGSGVRYCDACGEAVLFRPPNLFYNEK